MSKELLLGFAAVALTGQSAAQVIAEYNFDTLASIDSDPSTDAMDVSLSGDFSSGNVLGVGNAAFISVTNANEVLSSAISNGDYLSFQIGPATGFTTFTIDQVIYDHYITDTTNGPTYHSYLFSSIDGGLVAGNEIASSTINGDGTELPMEQVIFNASSSYEDLAAPVTFWIVATDNTSSNFHAFDNIVVTPEPGSLALLTLGGLCLSLRRRS